MKKLKWILMVAVMAGAAYGADQQGQYAHITQDDILLNLKTGAVRFNGDVIEGNQLAERIGSSYSIRVTIDNFSEQNNIENLFGDSSVDGKEKRPSAVSANSLLQVLEQISVAKIPPERVYVISQVPPQKNAGRRTRLMLCADGKVELNGKSMDISELPADKFSSKPVEIWYANFRSYVDYRQLLAVLRVLGPKAQVEFQFFQNRAQSLVQVNAKFYQLNDVGETNVLSAPMVTTKPGNAALIHVVENASGYKPYHLRKDNFHQEDLANLGIRFSVMPQIIGDYIRVSGVAIITQVQDSEEVFKQGNVPVYSYSGTKVVAPFSVVLPPGTEKINIPMAKVKGKKTFCDLSAVIVDDKGMTLKEREQARAQK